MQAKPLNTGLGHVQRSLARQDLRLLADAETALSLKRWHVLMSGALGGSYSYWRLSRLPKLPVNPSLSQDRHCRQHSSCTQFAASTEAAVPELRPF